MRKLIAAFLMLALVPVALAGRWHLEQAVVVLELKDNQLALNQVQVQWGTAQSADQGWQGWVIDSQGSGTLELLLRNGKFAGLGTGQLALQGPVRILRNGQPLPVSRLFLRAGPEEATLEFVDDTGRIWLFTEGFHHYLKPGEDTLALDAMSVFAGPALLQAVGMRVDSRWFLGRALVQAVLSAPVPLLRGNQLCANPRWDDGVNYQTDVALIDIPNVEQVGVGSNPGLTVAPSAELRNVGTADVPWFRKFSTPETGTYPPPYTRDQHPLLTWNMYRIDGSGLLRQIGFGEVKHAFNTVNYDCSCYQGGGSYEPWDASNPAGFYASILWSASHPDNTAGVGCRDIYWAGTNDYGGFLGLRSEVPAYTVDWEQCGSLFAPMAVPGAIPCSQLPASQYEAQPGERRMNIDPAELGDTASRYLVEAWYLIRDDINIFNTMGHVDVVPALDGSVWQFPKSNFANGSILDAWVDPANPGPEASSHTYDNGQGHAGLAVKVLPLGNGVFRWVLAVVNHDYDPAITRLLFDIDPGLNVLQAGFYDVDADTANDWTFTQTGQTLRWDAPAGNTLSWGRLYTFWFDMEAGPLPYRPMTTVAAEPVDMADTPFVFNALMPAQRVFSDSAE